jgi:hypothetical protein
MRTNDRQTAVLRQLMSMTRPPKLLYGANPLISRDPAGLKIRDAICAVTGHRPGRPDSAGDARCLRCLTALPADGSVRREHVTPMPPRVMRRRLAGPGRRRRDRLLR